MQKQTENSNLFDAGANKINRISLPLSVLCTSLDLALRISIFNQWMNATRWALNLNREQNNDDIESYAVLTDVRNQKWTNRKTGLIRSSINLTIKMLYLELNKLPLFRLIGYLNQVNIQGSIKRDTHIHNIVFVYDIESKILRAKNGLYCLPTSSTDYDIGIFGF